MVEGGSGVCLEKVNRNSRKVPLPSAARHDATRAAAPHLAQTLRHKRGGRWRYYVHRHYFLHRPCLPQRCGLSQEKIAMKFPRHRAGGRACAHATRAAPASKPNRKTGNAPDLQSAKNSAMPTTRTASNGSTRLKTAPADAGVVSKTSAERMTAVLLEKKYNCVASVLHPRLI